MTSFVIATQEAVLIVRQGRDWSVETYLQGKKAESAAVDDTDAARLYVGTMGEGLYASSDGGRTWRRKEGLPHAKVTAVAVGRVPGSTPGVVFAGTQPSTLSRSEDGGESWQELETLLELPSSSMWSFPPKPETHHVRWVEPDPNVAGKLYVAIEAGALVRSLDGGRTWQDRVPGGPFDTHTADTHHEAEGRVYSAAGDGYYESFDGGESWSSPMGGLRHGYLVGVAADAGDPDTVVVSAASGPSVAYSPRNARAYVYRKSGGGPFSQVMEGLPDAQGTVASLFATHPEEPGVFYAANNHGLFRSEDGGKRWQALPIEWPQGVFRHGVNAVAMFEE